MLITFGADYSSSIGGHQLAKPALKASHISSKFEMKDHRNEGERDRLVVRIKFSKSSKRTTGGADGYRKDVEREPAAS